MSLRKRCSRHVAKTLSDGLVNPFHCDKSPRCDHHWHYDFRVNRRRYRGTTETDDKGEAKDIEAKERSRILEGKHSIRRTPDITFQAFAHEYMKTHATTNKKASTVKNDWQMLNAQLLPVFGKFLLSEITKFQIEQHKAKRLAAGLQPGSVNRELSLLTGILTKAVEWGKLVKSPAVGVEKIKSTGHRTRILTTDEQRALLAAYDKGRRKDVKPIVELLLITGARMRGWAKCSPCNGGIARTATSGSYTRRTVASGGCPSRPP